MPKTQESLNTELDNLLASHGFDVTPMSSSGKQVPVPEEADYFTFHYHKDGQDYGTVTVTIDGNRELTIYFDDNLAKVNGSQGGSDIGFTELIKQLKRFAMKRQLTFDTKNTDRMRVDMKRRDHVQQQETSLNEGYYGNKKMSYSDDTPTVKMVIKHNKQLEETDQRFRHIDSIFLETSDGERFKAPTTKPSQARMFARHIAEGGAYQDDRWSHLKEICEDVDTLAGFCRATHNKREQFNESTQRMILEATERYAQLRENIKRLSTSRGYNKYFESYSPSVITETDDGLAEAFLQSSIDSRIERALPVLSKMGISYKQMNEASVFEQWVDDILGEALDIGESDTKVLGLINLLKDKNFKVGPNAENAIGSLNDIIEDDELYDRLRTVADKNSNNEAAPTIISWMQEQDNPEYKKILAELDIDVHDEDDKSENTAEPEKKPDEESANEQPAEVPPPPAPAPADPNAAPPMDPNAMPPEDPNAMPPLPPLAEDSEFARILKLSGLK